MIGLTALTLPGCGHQIAPKEEAELKAVAAIVSVPVAETSLLSVVRLYESTA